MARRESPAAQLARQRWKKKTPEQRSDVARELNSARWDKATPEDRAAVGARLAKARAAARKKKAKNGGKK
jgi:predicted Fe-S protein YdhL (DUF1289 family)